MHSDDTGVEFGKKLILPQDLTSRPVKDLFSDVTVSLLMQFFHIFFIRFALSRLINSNLF